MNHYLLIILLPMLTIKLESISLDYGFQAYNKSQI